MTPGERPPGATDAPVQPQSDVRADGRTTRWDAHRATRRAELTAAAMRAIRRHGPSIGMEEIAAEAGTSRTVLYRHLGDRAGAWRAVVEAVDATVLGDLQRASQEEGDAHTVIAALVDSYLALVERDPDIYRFVVTRPFTDTSGDDPVAGISARMGREVTASVEQILTRAGVPAARAAHLAPTWGHGLVGATRAVADDWLSDEHGTRRARADLVADIAGLWASAVDREATR